MNKFALKKSDMSLICPNCKDAPIRAGATAVAFKASYMCRCGELVRVKYNSAEVTNCEGVPALKDEDGIFCPVCSSLLFCVDKKSTGGFSFRVQCACGTVCECQREPMKHMRRVGSYASLDNMQDK